MNKVVLIGRLTKDPELKFTPGTGKAVATFNIAVDRKVADKNGQRQADFIRVVVWGKIAENTANYTVKGSLVGVSGRIQTTSYDAKDGTKKYVVEVVAEEVQFLGKKPGQESVQAESDYNFDGEGMVEDNGDIPF